MLYTRIINSVLRRLREDVIDTTSSWSGDLADASSIPDYQKLIGDFVNEVKQEVEDSWNWTSLRSTQSIATVASTRTYELDGITQRGEILSLRHQDDGTELALISDKEMQRRKYPVASSGKPCVYSHRGLVGEDLQIELDLLPDAVYNIDVSTINPQADLTEATDDMKVPAWPVILGAWSRAIAERGEDGGTLSDLAVLQYTSALSTAISVDEARTLGETTWHVR